MDERLYNTEVICPVCEKKNQITRARTKAVKVKERDSDFCVFYEDINPLFYDAQICEFCGYASLSDKFDKISYAEIKMVQQSICSKWKKRHINGERDLNHAIEAFKMVLLNLIVRNQKSIEFAKVCIRIAWLYRFANDVEDEKKFLEYALKAYMETYDNERFPIDKFDESTCLYIIAEIMRRIGNYSDSIKWFNLLISSPQSKKNVKILEMAKTQYQLAKELNKELIKT